MTFHSIPPLNPIDTLTKISNSTLIIPMISIGNIPQLLTDLLIHNLNCHLVARLDDEFLYPFVSPIDYLESEQTKQQQQPIGISTSLELFYNDELKLTVLQQRSPILPGLQNKFITELLVPFIKNVDFNHVIILNSSTPTSDSDVVVIDHDDDDYYNNKQQMMMMRKFQLYSTNLTDLFKKFNINDSNDLNLQTISNDKQFKSSFLSFLIHELVINDPLVEPLLLDQLQLTPSELDLYNQLNEKFPYSLPLSKSCYPSSSSLSKISTSNRPLSITVLSISSYEGDNSEDLRLLTLELLNILQIDRIEKDEILNLKNPKSWDGFYGSRDVPVGIEGLYS